MQKWISVIVTSFFLFSRSKNSQALGFLLCATGSAVESIAN